MTFISYLAKRRIAIVVSFMIVVAILAITYIHGHRPHNYSHELVRIDSLCERYPASADTLLRKVRKDSLTSDWDRIYYGLLRVKASNNLYKPQKDSTIFNVVVFFEDRYDDDKLCQSYYYQGKYYMQHNDMPRALKCMQMSLDKVSETTPMAFRSKIYSQSGNVFLAQELYEDALLMYRKSYACDSLLRDTVNMVNGLRDMAKVYRHLGNNKFGEALLKNAFSLCGSAPMLRKTIALVLVATYLDEDKVDKADSLFSRYLRTVDKGMESPVYSVAIRLYEKKGIPDSIYAYGTKLLSVGSLKARELALGNLVDYYSLKGDMRNVRSSLRDYRRVSESVRTLGAV